MSLKKEPLDTYLYREFSIAETTHKSGERKWGEGMSKTLKKVEKIQFVLKIIMNLNMKNLRNIKEKMADSNYLSLKFNSSCI